MDEEQVAADIKDMLAGDYLRAPARLADATLDDPVGETNGFTMEFPTGEKFLLAVHRVA